MIQDKFSEAEFEGLKMTVNSIKNHIPKDKMSLIWESYKVITGSKEPQPCGCPSSAGHWRKAFNAVSDYVNGKQ